MSRRKSRPPFALCTVATTLDFGGLPEVPAPPRASRGRQSLAPSGPQAIRRWESSETHRLNKAHWQNAYGNPINTDLMAELETLRIRCQYEAANNGIVEGVINTYCEDVVGDDGPTLQVLSDDDRYNRAAEQVWQDWFYAPCLNPRISGAAYLKQDVRSLWLCGEFLSQLVTGPEGQGPVSLRLNPIYPGRLATPWDKTGDPQVCMGIRFSSAGVPTQYYIQDAPPPGASLLWSGDYQTLPPDLMIHEFLLREEGQARGYPWLAPGLHPAAEIRDYDDQVLDTARHAAGYGVVWYTEREDAPFLVVNESIEMERGTERTGPPGYKPMQVNPAQPASNYVDFRRERQAEIGRPASMPLMTIRLDSSKHNYSSARFDGQNYHRAVRGIQTWISGSPRSYGCLSWLFQQVMAEARFSNAALRRTPPRVKLRFLWPVPPHVDPTKEGQAERIGIENGTLPFAVAAAARGFDEEAVFESERRTNQRRKAMGLPPIPPPGSYLRTAGAGVNGSEQRPDAQQIQDQIDDEVPADEDA